ncbi:hypothetical protein [Pseudomonas putida]|uniref:Uncharacterized protein n=1 Tax=Pseudomonas putida TaxID=303 RepID=A0A8I1JGA9_PSEPU|nr:hypothetical protein [Pseudomonas putida]MBI6882622.1 hypothetical protein [Pseudomonas putida]
MRTVEADQVLVSATHPVIGPLYWCHIPKDEHCPTDHFTVTDWADCGLKLPFGWRAQEDLSAAHIKHIENVIDPLSEDSDYQEIRCSRASDAVERQLSGTLARLQGKSGQTVDQFVAWLIRADWKDTPCLVQLDIEE